MSQFEDAELDEDQIDQTTESEEDIEVNVLEESLGDQEFNEEELHSLQIKEEESEFIEASTEDEPAQAEFEAEGTELASFQSAEIEELEFIEEDQIVGIIEAILFSTDKSVSIAAIKQAFKGTQVKTPQIRRGLDQLMISYAGGDRGVTLEEVSGGYQLRTKIDLMPYLRQMVKGRPFKLSGPALEVLSIVVYKQPLIKSEVDEIRGVESGHLMRALMEKGLVNFAGKSDHPGKPMLYQTTKKFLEIFGLRNLKELPSLSEIDELIPEGIGEVEAEEEKLGDITDSFSQESSSTYSEGEAELMKITGELDQITTSSDFFVQEKRRQKIQRDKERAQDIRDAQTMGEEVPKKDQRWLEKFEQELVQFEADQKDMEQKAANEVAEVVDGANVEPSGIEEGAVEEPPEVQEPETDLLVNAELGDLEFIETEGSAEEQSPQNVGLIDESDLPPPLPSEDEEAEEPSGGESENQVNMDVQSDSEEANSRIGNVDVARLKADLDAFEN